MLAFINASGPSKQQQPKPIMYIRKPTLRNHLLPLQLILRNPKSHLQHLLLLLQMRPLQPRRHTSTGVAARIHHMLPIMMLRLIQERLQSRLREAPRAGIQRLLLRPHDGLCVGVAVEVVLELGPGEGVELLDARDGDLLVVGVRGAVFVESGVDLAAAEDDAVGFFGGGYVAGRVGGVGDYPLKVRIADEVGDGGAG